MFHSRKVLSVAAMSIAALLFACTKSANVTGPAPGSNDKVATIDGKDYTLADLMKKKPGDFYEIEQKKHDLVRETAMGLYFDSFFEKEAKKRGMTVADAKKKIMEENGKASDAQFTTMYEQLKNHPQVAHLPEAEKKQRIRDYVNDNAQANYMKTLVAEAQSSGAVKVLYPEPTAPTYDIAIREDDQIRFGPGVDDIKPKKCEGDSCVTIIEYSGFQCPACRASAATTQKVLEEYAGKVRWIMRDFPLSFHKRSTPSAIAAHCAGDQGKYWHLYSKFYETGKLEDSDIQGFAKEAKLDMGKFNECIKSGKYAALVEKNLQSGLELSVNGTPAFFIDGQKLGGVSNYAEFQKIIDSELKKKG